MDITIESGTGHMRLATLKSIHIRNVEINLVLATTISASDPHISLMKLRSRVGARPRHVARLLARVADALKRTAATTAMSTPTATIFDPTASAVDLLRTIAVAAKARLLLETLEEGLFFLGGNQRAGG